MEDDAASSCVGAIIKLLYIIFSRYYITQSINNESQFQHYKIHRRYGVLRRADVYRVPSHRLFLIRKDIGGGWQWFHRRKCRVGHSVADGRDNDGEGGVMGLLDLFLNQQRCATKHIVISVNVEKIEMFFTLSNPN